MIESALGLNVESSDRERTEKLETGLQDFRDMVHGKYSKGAPAYGVDDRPSSSSAPSSSEPSAPQMHNLIGDEPSSSNEPSTAQKHVMVSARFDDGPAEAQARELHIELRLQNVNAFIVSPMSLSALHRARASVIVFRVHFSAG